MERLKKWILGLGIGVKLQICIALTVVLALVILIAIAAAGWRGAMNETARRSLLSQSESLAGFLAGEGLTGGEGLSRRLAAFKAHPDSIITTVGPDGSIISVTGHDKDFSGRTLSSMTEFSAYFRRDASAGKDRVYESRRPFDGKTVLVAVSVLPGDGGFVAVDLPLKAAMVSGASFMTTLWIFGILSIIAIIGVIWLATNRLVVRPVVEIQKVFEQISTENYEARAAVTTEDELGRMAGGLNDMLDTTMGLIQSSEERDSMQGSIMNLLEEISGLAEGDLTARAEVTEDFTGAIADSFNEMAEQLSEVVKNVKDVTLQVIGTSQQVTRSTENLAETSEMQAVQVSEAIAAINDISTSIQQVAENAGRCASVSEQSTQHAKEGAGAVRNTNRAMESIREHAQETARAIKRLGESSQEIGNIVQMINDIADRTSILALNASIQAAMAGDAGRGFAVVAEEVQRLAERSTEATKQIDTLIKNIQGEINEAGASMEESIQRVVEGSHLADGARNKLQEIETVSSQLGALIKSISQASRQQAKASEDIAKTMEEVGEISSQTSAASRQTAVSMKSLAQMSSQLNESVSVFRLEEDV